MNLRHEVQEIASELEIWASDNGLILETKDALKIAVEIQRNKLYKDAHVLWTGSPGPSALENISMQLDRVADSISELAASGDGRE